MDFSNDYMVTIFILVLIIIALVLYCAAQIKQKLYYKNTCDEFRNGIEMFSEFIVEKKLVPEYQKFVDGIFRKKNQSHPLKYTTRKEEIKKAQKYYGAMEKKNDKKK